MTIILSNLNRFKKNSLEDSLVNLQELDCLVHFLRLLALCWPSAQSA